MIEVCDFRVGAGDLDFVSALEGARAIRRGEVSSVELTTRMLHRKQRNSTGAARPLRFDPATVSLGVALARFRRSGSVAVAPNVRAMA